MQTGDEVWIEKSVKEPSRGWIGVTPISKGRLLSIDGDEVTVSFPEFAEWKGFLKEIEKTRPIVVGDEVKVGLLQ